MVDKEQPSAAGSDLDERLDAPPASAARTWATRARQARDWLVDRWGQFRAESPYFQAKVGLVAAYAVIVVATIALAPPSPEPWQARQERLPFGLAFKTALVITNVDGGDHDGVVVEVRGKGIEFDGKETTGVWRTKPLALPQDDARPTRVLTEQLFDDKGLNPPYSLIIETATVLDDDKDVIVVLRPTGGAR